MVEASGGSSQIAHLTTATVVALVLLFFTGPLRYLPVCVLGTIVFVVAVHLVDLNGLRKLRRRSPHEFILALLTIGMFVFIGVAHGILLALILSMILHVRHGYRPHTAVILHDATDHWRMETVAPGKMIEPGLVMYWFGSDLYYANANHFTEEVLRLVSESPSPVRWLVVEAGAITSIDYTAASELKQLQRDLSKLGVVLAFTRVNADFRADLDRMELTDVIGAEHIFSSRKACIAAYQSQGGTT